MKDILEDDDMEIKGVEFVPYNGDKKGVLKDIPQGLIDAKGKYFLENLGKYYPDILQELKEAYREQEKR